VAERVTDLSEEAVVVQNTMTLDTNAGRQTLTNRTVANRSRVGELAVAFEVLALQLADKREVAGTGERNFNATVNGCLLGVVAEVEVEAVVAQTEVTGDGALSP
jgi:hypothetical protein